MRGANGHKMCSLSLLSCSKKTISTNNALNMKNANTDLFLSSIKSRAIRACFYLTVALSFYNFGQILIMFSRNCDSPKIIKYNAYVVCRCVVFIEELMKSKREKRKILKNVLKGDIECYVIVVEWPYYLQKV